MKSADIIDEYISKESAISIFRAKAEMAVCTPAQTYFDRAAKMLELLPAADVAPVRHGRWLSWDELHGGNTSAKNVLGVFCSECIRQYDSKTHFCPNCGAKMDGRFDNG